jgi:hypothetical protein
MGSQKKNREVGIESHRSTCNQHRSTCAGGIIINSDIHVQFAEGDFTVLLMEIP